MELSEYRIYLDIHQTHSGKSLDVKKTDTGRRILISLMDGGFTYNITSECFAVLNGVKPDGAILFKRCAIQDNTIIYEIDEATTNTIGIFECEIRLYGANDKVITSPGFDIVVNDSSYDPSVAPTSEVDALTHLISEATTVITEGKTVNAEAESLNQESEALIADMEAKRETLDQQIQETGSAAANAQRYAQLASQASQSASNSSSIAYNRAQDAQTAAGNAKTSENNAKASAQTAVNMANAALQSQRAAEDAAERAEAAAEQAGNGSDSGQNPSQGTGLTTTEKNHLLTILDAVIVETSKQPVVAEALAALKQLWSGGEVYVSQIGTTLALENVTAVTSITQNGSVLALA